MQQYDSCVRNFLLLFSNFCKMKVAIIQKNDDNVIFADLTSLKIF